MENGTVQLSRVYIFNGVNHMVPILLAYLTLSPYIETVIIMMQFFYKVNNFSHFHNQVKLKIEHNGVAGSENVIYMYNV
jgi:hypothetical protein